MTAGLLLERDGDLSRPRGVSVSLPGSILSISSPSTTLTNSGRSTLPLSRLPISTISDSASTPSITLPLSTLSTVPIPGSTSSASTTVPTGSSPSASTSDLSASFTSSPIILSSSPSLFSTSSSSIPQMSSFTSNSIAITTSPTLVPSVTPSAVARLSSRKHVGAIVGGVIGGIAFVLLVMLGLLLYLRIRQQSSRRSRSRSMGESDSRGPLGKWNGLSSRDSTVDGATSGTKHASRLQKLTHGHADSAGAIASVTESSAGHSTNAGLAEDGLSLSEETKVNHNSPSEYITTIPPLAYDVSRSSSFGGADPTGSPRRGRKSSSGQYAHALALSKLETNSALGYSGPPSPPHAAYAPGVSPVATRTSAGSYAPDTRHSATPVNRTSSGANRRPTTRKPVPSYHSASMEPAPAPSIEVHTDENASGTSTPIRDATPSRSHSREDLTGRSPHVPDLNHKSSFGEARALHYLVPDLPPASRE